MGTDLQGISRIKAWLAQLDSETRWIAVPERTRPDNRGRHVSLCNLMHFHKTELRIT